MEKRYLEHETSAYSLHSDRFGNFLLHRRADGAECYFQGDDAQLWRHNIDAIVSIDQSATGWSPNNSFDKSFDCLCSGYDDVLEIAA
jgi:hypothetical protein